MRSLTYAVLGAVSGASIILFIGSKVHAKWKDMLWDMAKNQSPEPAGESPEPE